MKDLFELIEFADEKLKSNAEVDIEVINKIKDAVADKEYYGLAQINTQSGNFKYNAKKIAKYIKFASKIGIKAIVFPELALSGCFLKDIIVKQPIIADENVKWIKELAKITKDTIAFVGFIEPGDDNIFYNSIAILHQGGVQNVVRKSVYSNGVITFLSNGCNTYDGFTVLENTSINDINKSLETNLFINCSNNTYSNTKCIINKSVLSYISEKYSTPLISVNSVGANDNILFEGVSCVFNSKGKLIARAKALEEQLLLFNAKDNIGKIYSLPQGYEKTCKKQTHFSLNYENELERTYKALVIGIKDYFTKCGIKRAVLGLSGGLDSTVCAVLLADSLGKENVLGVSMPSRITTSSSRSDAEQLANNLGINFIEVPIRSMVDTTTECFNVMFDKIQNSWTDRYKKSFTADNIQARSRAMILYGISNEFPSCIPIATSDKSEAYMGYATINGDMSGGFAPIADITKTKLFALARWLNRNRQEKDVIPESIILKRPGAELAIDPKTGKPLIAEDALMPYEFLDEIIWRIENNHDSYKNMLESEFIYEKHNSVSKEQKIEWLEKFYYRMSTAIYKWSIMAPSTVVEAHSINKSVYKQLITSSKIDYKGVSEEFISENLA